MIFLLFALVFGSSQVVTSTLMAPVVAAVAVVVAAGTACFLGLEERSKVKPIRKIAKRMSCSAVPSITTEPQISSCFTLFCTRASFFLLRWVLVLARRKWNLRQGRNLLETCLFYADWAPIAVARSMMPRKILY